MADRTYQAEMAALADTYAQWRDWRREDPHAALRAKLGGPAAFVASGGSLAVAHLGATLHQRRHGQAALVLTPLDLAATRVELETVFVISDSMSHPDALLAVDVARRSDARTVVVLSNRPVEHLRERLGPDPQLVSCPRPGHDGWIATNSVLSLSLGMLTLYGQGEDAPAFGPLRDRWLAADGTLLPEHDTTRESVLCLHTPGLRNVAVDFETRLSEAGLGQVTATDLRNLGHGRHVGLYRHAESTTLVILAEPSWTPLVRATVASLPPGAEARVWTGASDGWSPVELLVPSAGFLASRAAAVGVDPGNPDVWPGGNGLFRARMDQLLPELGDAWM
ncbi:hypothetical protein IPZ64_02430 [Streptomyces violaceoruber]|uniref:hypothetical protein n=1 Tax=Streptomyces violaceoruber TaxID=1935 RepID=UPI001F1865AD|nr:hypothetical protein [Streptomyces violaceoruber]MCF3165792.1 hypothetical protein [Streptomyces violaceoruber]